MQVKILIHIPKISEFFKSNEVAARLTPVCHSIQRKWGLPQCMLGYNPLGRHSSRQTPPGQIPPPDTDTHQTDTPTRQTHPPGRHTPWEKPPLQTPPWADDPGQSQLQSHPTGMHSYFILCSQKWSLLYPEENYTKHAYNFL